MFTEKDILERLKKGETSDAIAKEMTEMLNAANKTYSDEQAKAKRSQETKLADMEMVLFTFEDYLRDNTSMTDKDIKTVFETMTPETMVKMVDEMVELFDSINVLADKLDKKFSKDEGKKATPNKTWTMPLGDVKFTPTGTNLLTNPAKSATTILDEFLKKNGL